MLLNLNKAMSPINFNNQEVNMFGSKKKNPDFKFDLGDEARDAITGFSGVIVYRTQWIHNCNVYGLQPRELKDGHPLKSKQFDEPQLELVKKKAEKASRKTGGPNDSMEASNRM